MYYQLQITSLKNGWTKHYFWTQICLVGVCSAVSILHLSVLTCTSTRLYYRCTNMNIWPYLQGNPRAKYCRTIWAPGGIFGLLLTAEVLPTQTLSFLLYNFRILVYVVSAASPQRPEPVVLDNHRVLISLRNQVEINSYGKWVLIPCTSSSFRWCG